MLTKLPQNSPKTPKTSSPTKSVLMYYPWIPRNHILVNFLHTVSVFHSKYITLRKLSPAPQSSSILRASNKLGKCAEATAGVSVASIASVSHRNVRWKGETC